MTLKEFYRKYCSDIVDRVASEHAAMCPYPYDVIDTDDEGDTIYCIRTSDEELLNIDDVIFMTDDVFKSHYPKPSAFAARQAYMSKLTVFDGADALRGLSIELSREKKRREENIKEAERLLDDQHKASEMFTFG